MNGSIVILTIARSGGARFFIHGFLSIEQPCRVDVGKCLSDTSKNVEGRFGSSTTNMGEGTRCNEHLITKLGIVEMLFLDDQLDFFFVSHVLMGFMWVFSIFY